MLISAADLIALYLGLELMSLALYVVAAINRDNVRSTEAGLKYFVLGALSSGMLLYGCSLIYGFTGTVSFAGIAKAAGQGGLGLMFGLVFLFAGFCFKVSAVPFHMWTPDVYEGAPTPVTAFFAAAPKVAGDRDVRARHHRARSRRSRRSGSRSWCSSPSPRWCSARSRRSARRNIKRLMAYSSIGHMGFALIGLAAGTPEGVQGVLVYMAIYLAMTLGTFACILSMRRGDGMVEKISDLAGLARTKPAMAFFLAMLLFSLAGIPPLAGFFAKFYVFLAAIKAGLYALAVIGVLASVVGAYYYLLIVKIMYFDEPAPDFEPMPGELKAVLGVTGLFNLLFFVYPAPLVARRRRRGEIAVLMRARSRAPRRPACGSSATIRIGSTNAEALALARAGERGPLWVTAQRQSAGRGRRGRDLGLRAGQSLRQPAAERSGAAGARRRSCRSSRRSPCMTPSRRASRAGAAASALKWPNDLLLDGAKFAGILVEGEGGGTVVVGIGVNCAHHPAGTEYPGDRSGGRRRRATSPERLFAALSAAMVARLAQWDRGAGFAAIRADWLARAAGLGKPIRVRLGRSASCRQLRGASTTPAAWCCACPTATIADRARRATLFTSARR